MSLAWRLHAGVDSWGRLRKRLQSSALVPVREAPKFGKFHGSPPLRSSHHGDHGIHGVKRNMSWPVPRVCVQRHHLPRLRDYVDVVARGLVGSSDLKSGVGSASIVTGSLGWTAVIHQLLLWLRTQRLPEGNKVAKP